MLGLIFDIFIFSARGLPRRCTGGERHGADITMEGKKEFLEEDEDCDEEDEDSGAEQ